MELADSMSKGISVNTSGINETLAMFEKLSNEAEGTMKQCVYKGAGVVADTMRQNVEALKTQSNNKRTDVRYLYEYEKQALIDSMGVAPIKGGDDTNTKVGFDGYYETKSGKRHNIQMLANSVNSGTSFMKKQPFINATKRKSESPCVGAMQKQLDKAIEKVTK
jgi:HK97 gp10 family phage protein